MRLIGKFPACLLLLCLNCLLIVLSMNRKYHILDDLARLRDVLSLLPERRHYVPSLFVVNWDSQAASEIASDIRDMVSLSYLSEENQIAEKSC